MGICKTMEVMLLTLSCAMGVSVEIAFGAGGHANEGEGFVPFAGELVAVVDWIGVRILLEF